MTQHLYMPFWKPVIFSFHFIFMWKSLTAGIFDSKFHYSFFYDERTCCSLQGYSKDLDGSIPPFCPIVLYLLLKLFNLTTFFSQNSRYNHSCLIMHFSLKEINPKIFSWVLRLSPPKDSCVKPTKFYMFSHFQFNCCFMFTVEYVIC